LRILLHAGGHADASWLCERLQACRHVDPITEDVTSFDDDVSLMNTDPEPDALVLGHPSISLRHAPLDLNGTADRIDYACELGQQAVPSGFDDAATMLDNPGGYKLAVEELELGKGALLVGADQTAVTRDACSQDRRESSSDSLPLHAQSSSGGT
jgi:hypothetical protein